MAIFILSMIGVVASENYFALLLNWEIMSLSSFFLVILERKQAENIKAGIYYLVMTQLSTVFLFFSCLVTYSSTGSMAVNASMPPWRILAWFLPASCLALAPRLALSLCTNGFHMPIQQPLPIYLH
jgi:formate hydrogenlyase subunit 3/multisubunit Na+/H+ antiporter MnhD subunit